MRRPALISAAALSCGILFGYYSDPPVFAVLISFSLLFVLSLLFVIFKRSENLPVTAIFLLMLAMGGALRYEIKGLRFQILHTMFKVYGVLQATDEQTRALMASPKTVFDKVFKAPLGPMEGNPHDILFLRAGPRGKNWRLDRTNVE